MLWKESCATVAEATDDYADLFRKLSQMESPLDAPALWADYVQTSSRKQLDNVMKAVSRVTSAN